MKNRTGFTLIEMLIVIVIIGILATALIPKITGVREKAHNINMLSQGRDIQQALELYHADHGEYPATSNGVETCIGSGSGPCDMSIARSSPMDQDSNIALFTTNYLGGSISPSAIHGSTGSATGFYYYRNAEHSYQIAFWLNGANQSCSGIKNLADGYTGELTSNKNSAPNRENSGTTLCFAIHNN